MFAPAFDVGTRSHRGAARQQLAAEISGLRRAAGGQRLVDWAQTGKQHFHVVQLQRHVGTVADFTLPSHTARQGGIEADAEQVDVFRIFNDQRSRVGGRRRQDHVGGTARQQRQAAVVVHGVETEFGLVQVFGVPAQRQTELTRITGFIVFQAGTGGTAGRCQQGGCGRRTVNGRKFSEAVRIADLGLGPNRARGADDAGVGVFFRVPDRLGHGTEAEHDVGAARRGEVIGAEVGAGRIDFGRLPVELVVGFHRHRFAELGRGEQHIGGQEGFLQFGTGHAQARDVDRVDHVDAVLDEGAFAPAHDLFTEADGAGHFVIGADGVVLPNEGVVQTEVAGDLFFGGLGEVVTVAVFEIVEVAGAGEEAPVAVGYFQLGGDLEGV